MATTALMRIGRKIKECIDEFERIERSVLSPIESYNGYGLYEIGYQKERRRTLKDKLTSSWKNSGEAYAFKRE